MATPPGEPQDWTVQPEEELGHQDVSASEEARSITRRLSALHGEIHETLEKLPELIEKTRAELSRAEDEFRKDAYQSFWFCVDNASDLLDDYGRLVLRLKQGYFDYYELLKGRRHTFPDLPDLRIVKPVGEQSRLNTLFQQGQRHKDFAHIYGRLLERRDRKEQRRILVDGFQAIDRAADGMGTIVDSAFAEASSEGAEVVVCLGPAEIRKRAQNEGP